MLDQATNLRRGIQHKMDFLKSELLKMGYSRTLDRKKLADLTLTELEQIYENVKCQYEVITLEKEKSSH